MAINTRFEVYKLQRELRKSGVLYEFRRPHVDDFNQKSNEYEEDTIDVLGIYHEQNSYITLQSDESSVTRFKKIPMILCEYEQAKLIKKDDTVTINGKDLIVTGVTNVQEWGLIADISLEVLDVI